MIIDKFRIQIINFLNRKQSKGLIIYLNNLVGNPCLKRNLKTLSLKILLRHNLNTMM
jgi:hypothetical protein